MMIAAERQGLLAAWGYRDYRLLWGCTLGIYTGVWIEIVIASWLVLELTNFQVMQRSYGEEQGWAKNWA